MRIDKKKIAIILPSLAGGGAEKVMVTLANYFVANSFKVDLLLVSKEGVYFNRLSADVRLINLNSSRALFAIPKILRYLNNEKPEVLLSALTHMNIVVLLCKIISFRRVKVVISERSILSNNSLIKGYSRIFNTKLLLHFLYPFADAIIAISNGVATDLINTIKITNKRIKVVYNPMTEDYNKNMEESFCQLKWTEIIKNNEKTPIIIAAGRLEKVKNYTLLINAFANLRKKRAAILIILGDGSERKSIQKLIINHNLEQDIHLMGFVHNPIVFMKRANVFVLSSNWEGFGNVIIEAMSVGLRIVSTDCSGPREILEDGKWGKLVPVNNIELFSKAMEDIIDEDINYDVRERAAQFSLDKIARQYIDAMQV